MLTLQFMPGYELQGLDVNQKIRKILGLVRKDRILVIEGRLSSEEEALLIQRTMEEISREFKGVEICSVDYRKNEKTLPQKIREALASFILGGRDGFSIVGPASIVREIKRNPDKIELLFANKGKR